jgi:hypothetical protein
MSKKYSEELTLSQIKELESIMDELADTATDVVDDFIKNPSDLNSGSAVQIHELSPYLDTVSDTDDEKFEGNRWKRVIKKGLPVPPTSPEE